MFRDENTFFAQLFNSTQSFVALFKPIEQQFIQVNRYGINMFEMQDTNEFVSFFQSGKIWHDPLADLQVFLQEIESIVHSNGYLENEMLFQTASGKPFWGLLRIDALDIEGENHFLIKITNIDAFKKAELVATRNFQQLQSLFSNSVIGIVITNQEGQIINFNQFAEQQFGYNKEEIIGQPVEMLIPQNLQEKHEPYRDAFIRHPQNREMGAGRDLYAKRKDTSEFPVEISLSHYEIEEKSYVIAFIADISVRKRNEILVLRQKDELEKISDQIRQLNVELERKVEDRTKMLKETMVALELSKEELRAALIKEKELGELKSRFVIMASHEFRTPLSTILSSAYIVEQYKLTEEQEKRTRHLLKIQDSVQTLTSILEDFLSLEKLEEGLVQVNFQPVTADELMEEIKSISEEVSQMLKKEQCFEYDYAALSTVNTDKKLLRNILVNLISNAAKYSPEHSTITISSCLEVNCLKISVTDQGIGIPESEQQHLFERFFRASNTSNVQGTGLGLHIVNRYLKLIQGDITMKSELNKGSTFTLMLDTSSMIKGRHETATALLNL